LRSYSSYVFGPQFLFNLLTRKIITFFPYLSCYLLYPLSKFIPNKSYIRWTLVDLMGKFDRRF
jgi:hypothetical protein